MRLLRSWVWADRVDHLRCLDDAVAVVGNMPAIVEQADGADWLDRHLRPQPGVVTVLYHSLMQASCPSSPSLARMEATLRARASLASPSSPLAHVQLEPPDLATPTLTGAHRLAEMRLTTWPGELERLLATADVNGGNVQWLL